MSDDAGSANPGGTVARWALAAALAWGFAEATLFFMIPDVLLSGIALWSKRLAYVACGWACAGALAGGALMHAWAGSDPHAARRALDRVPAVSPAMLERVAAEHERNGLVALLSGPARGTPYKIYAVESGAAGDSLVAFLLVSAPARLLRFVLVAALAGWIASRLQPAATAGAVRAAWLGVWTAVYVVYFSWFGF